jgi:hypothetical protein
MTDRITKSFLVKEISERAFFTKNDTRLFLNTFEEVIQDLIAQKSDELRDDPTIDNIEVLSLKGLFVLRLRRLKPHNHFNFQKNKKEMTPEFYRLIFAPAITLRHYAKKDESEDENNLQDGGSE